MCFNVRCTFREKKSQKPLRPKTLPLKYLLLKKKKKKIRDLIYLNNSTLTENKLLILVTAYRQVGGEEPSRDERSAGEKRKGEKYKTILI